jgi:tripartite-type tricarboxylate transporter receptor subunit TctC
MTKRRGLALIAGALCAAAGFSLPAGAQALEGGLLKIVVPYPPGGSSDRAARLLAEALQPRVGVPVIVENRAGAGGRLAAQQLKREPAESNVLMLANPAVMVVAPLVYKDNGYDADKDFQPVSQVTSYDFAVAVATAVPVRELPHLVAWLKANPDKANLGVPATGSLPHFFALMVSEKVGMQPLVVGYKGSAPLLNDLMGGHVPVAVDTLDTLEPQHESGKLRILAVSSDKRSASLPKVPTFKESGFDLSARGWNVLYAPAAMPAAKVKRLAADVKAAMADAGLRAKFAAAKMDPVSASTEQTAAMLKGYKAQWAPVIQKSGFNPN